MMHVTKSAARHIKDIQAKESSGTSVFRVSAHPGCGGFEYHVGLDMTRKNDLKMDSYATPIIMNLETDSLTENVELDYSDESHSFVFLNMPEYPGCGCGGSCEF